MRDYRTTKIEADEIYLGGVPLSAVNPSGVSYFSQASPSGNVPVITLNQSDESEPFINYIGTSSAISQSFSISTQGAHATGVDVSGPDKFDWIHTGMIQIEVNGVQGWMPFYVVNT